MSLTSCSGSSHLSSNLDTAAVQEALTRFVRSHRAEFDRLSGRKSQLLEVGSLAVCAEHYRLAGYEVRPSNVKNGVFRVKLGSRGHPWNFSWFECTCGPTEVSIHSNLSVYGAYRIDEGVYVVDVAVTHPGAVPRSDPGSAWRAAENEALVTFAEAKYLVIYPMLLAQFVGIVNEIKPQFLRNTRPEQFSEAGHFDPTLMAVGYLHATARKIASAYATRGYLLRIVPSLDVKLTLLRRGGRLRASVLEEDDADLTF